ncbi:DNA/RNA non-specific endonuclease [Sorangium sp. So ce1000]|uniref:DNA/RNA non-specific endonuclease n=1 Tax=Sorangium sp. So ce1000 TaxID=3133325 RepID=UPI003F60059F
MKAVSALVCASLLAVVGCASGPVGDEEPLDALERDYGGPDGVMDLFENGSEDEVRSALEEYGIGYAVQELISDCPQYFPSGDRNVWHSFDGEFYYIDGSGRPYRAYAYLPPIAAAPRKDTCQGNVGRWGDAENPSNDYDGGHMIGSQLGGWGGRANLVPQDANFNRGNWVGLENKMALCASLPSGRMRYYIGANYPNSSALIPNTMTMEITNRSTGSSVSMSFANTDGGGSNGTSEKNRGVSWLDGQGCR